MNEIPEETGGKIEVFMGKELVNHGFVALFWR